MKATHDNKGSGLFGYFCEPLSLVEGAGHGGDGDQVNRIFFQQCAEAFENTVIIVIFGHNDTFNIMLDGGREVTNANTIGNEAGKGGYNGLGSFNKTEMVEICHIGCRLELLKVSRK